MKKILVTGACGQIGSELVVHLGKKFGKENVISSDIKRPASIIKEFSTFMYLNVLDTHMLAREVVENEIDTIFHMAAILSATGEQNPQFAYEVNMQGLMNVLEVARRKEVQKVITPSSIAVFGPDAPKEMTPEDTSLNPTTMYGVTKVAGEKLMQYYHLKYGLDTRSLRYPGIISSETLPGGGTTDFAVDMYIHAVLNQPYTCFVTEDTPLPFMYMPDAIRAILELAEAEEDKLTRRVYNVHAMRLTPADIVDSIRKYIPEFRCEYQPDYRQDIAESWPHSIDDSAARKDWGWLPQYNLDDMTRDMLDKLREKHQKKVVHL
ncbi:MAG: NAD-dependent epimerase/dehydratase family protein [Calditrichaeota bacterium]|nr:MAG: NAD-dependent epimerase/dehydratase family protein [Calditrichota bacterium]